MRKNERTKMGKKIKLEPVKLIAGFIYQEMDVLTEILEKMESKFPDISYSSDSNG